VTQEREREAFVVVYGHSCLALSCPVPSCSAAGLQAESVAAECSGFVVGAPCVRQGLLSVLLEDEELAARLGRQLIRVL